MQRTLSIIMITTRAKDYNDIVSHKNTAGAIHRKYSLVYI